jgi:hypothetical protein
MIIRSTLLALALTLIGICAFVGICAYKTRLRAQILLNDFQALGTSTNPTATFELLRQRHGNRLHMLGCRQQVCQYEMSVSNRGIAKALVPYTEMNVWFTVYQGSLQFAMLEYRTALNAPNSPVIHVQEGLGAHGCGVGFDVNPHGTSQQLWNGLVEFDPSATRQQRDAALAVNLECLTRVHGCKDITDLLPTVWTHTSPGTISSRLVGLSQILEESHGFPSETTIERCDLM